jgi:hypothetical protein
MWMLLIPIERSFMRSSVALRLMRCAIRLERDVAIDANDLLVSAHLLSRDHRRPLGRERADGPSPARAAGRPPHHGPTRLLSGRAHITTGCGTAHGPCARIVLDTPRHVGLGRRRSGSGRHRATRRGHGNPRTTGPVFDPGLGPGRYFRNRRSLRDGERRRRGRLRNGIRGRGAPVPPAPQTE